MKELLISLLLICFCALFSSFSYGDPVNTEGTGEVLQQGPSEMLQPPSETGWNDVDGSFIRQGFNWYLTPRSYMKTLFFYANITHFGASLATNYILLNNMGEGEIRLGGNETEKNYGGWDHFIPLGPKLSIKDVYENYRPGGKNSYELELQYSSRERPNRNENNGPFTRLSLMPKITIRFNRKPLPYLGEPFTYYFEASTALVSEEVSVAESPVDHSYTLSSRVDNYYADIQYGIGLGWFGKFNFGVDVASSKYDGLKGEFEGVTIEANDFKHWDRAEENMAIKQTYFSLMDLTCAYNHYIVQDGESPYMYENYWFSNYDTFTGSVKFKIGLSYLSMKANYDVPDMDLQSVKYQLMVDRHAYALLFEYALKNNIDVYKTQFDFSIELLPANW